MFFVETPVFLFSVATIKGDRENGSVVVKRSKERG